MRKKKPKPAIALTVRKRYQGWLFLGFGIILLALSLTHFYLQRRALTLSRSQVTDYLSTSVTRPAVPSQISIQWFIDTPIESMSLTNGIWGVSAEKASYLIQSARPGEHGNIIVYGHNTRKILGNIRALKGGETVLVTTSDAVVHRYRVSRLVEVEPSEVSLLQATTTETLTLYTCSGLFDSKRFIVQAIPLK